jgi:Protein of unknown function (DUF1403)
MTLDADSPERNLFNATFIPPWARPREPAGDPMAVAFLAGASLNSLDKIVRMEAPWQVTVVSEASHGAESVRLQSTWASAARTQRTAKRANPK